MTERTWIANIVNIGVEATHGTSVAASKRLECFDFVFAPAANIKMYAATGHLYSTVQEENMEWMDLTLGGIMDYNGVLYPLSGAAGGTSPVAHGASATAKDWIFTPPITYPVVDPKTYTLEQGDSVRAHKTTYGLFTSFGYTMSRKDTKITGKALAQNIQDNIVLTASPTAIALSPIVGKHVNVYLDSTSGALGTTLLTRAFQVDYLFDAIYTGFYPLNRANLSFTGHVNAKPKCTMKLLLEADSNGMALLTNMQAGSTVYMRVQAQGSSAIATDGPGNVFATFQHDMALKVSKPNPFKNEQDIFAAEWEFEIVEDPAWNSGQAQLFTVTNLLTAL